MVIISRSFQFHLFDDRAPSVAAFKILIIHVLNVELFMFIALPLTLYVRRLDESEMMLGFSSSFS